MINCFMNMRLSQIYGPLFETAAYFSIELPEQNCYILEQYSNHRYGLIFLRDNSCLIQITCSVATISIRCHVNFQNDKVWLKNKKADASRINISTKQNDATLRVLCAALFTATALQHLDYHSKHSKSIEANSPTRRKITNIKSEVNQLQKRNYPGLPG